MEKIVSVVGAGAWGTTIADLMAKKGYEVKLWCMEEDVAHDINNINENRKYLNGTKLCKSLKAYKSLNDSVSNTSLIIFVIPSQFLRKTISDAALTIDKNVLILSATKGIEKGTLKRPSEIITEELKTDHIAVLSGPNLSKEIAKRLPAASVVACKDHKRAEMIQQMLNTEYFRIYTSEDVIGVELGGALKNVIAIAAGACDGLHLGDNAKSALLVRGIAEIARLGKASGAKSETFYGLSGIGDLITTCSSELSRNHFVGKELALGKKLPEIIKNMNSIAEGIETSISAKELAAKLNVDMPITTEVYRVLFEGKNPKEAILSLMTRSLKKED